MIWALIIMPAAAGALAFFLGSDRLRRALLVGTAVAHFMVVLTVWQMPRPLTTAAGWLVIDEASLLFLSICSGLFLVSAVYALGYLGPSHKTPIRDYLEGFSIRQPARRDFHRVPVAVPGHHVHGNHGPSPGPALGGRGSHHPVQRPAYILSPATTAAWKQPGSIC